MKATTSNDETPIRVLLVEDNPIFVQALRAVLGVEEPAFEIAVVDTLAAALARLETGGIDVILSDLNLPDARGIETFERLRAHPCSAPIIVLSGSDDEALALRTVAEGAQDYLVKSEVTRPLLLRSIRYAMKRAEADRKLAMERNLLRNVIDNIPDAIYVKDAEGRYILDNLAHRTQLQVGSGDEVVGRTVFDFFAPEIALAFHTDDEEVMRTGEPILNRHEAAGEAPDPVRWLSTTKVPLRDPRGQIIGIVGLGRDITARKQAELKLAQYTEELRGRNAEMQDDMNMAREVQQAFLPQQFPRFPPFVAEADSALRFHVRYLPTTTLGGDFFHVFPISDTRAGVFICDVMGHGVRAALVTAIQRALVEELSSLADRPGEFLTEMNSSLVALLRRTQIPMFVSAFYMVADVAAGTLQYANAGHPQPLRIQREAQLVELLAGGQARGGPALGVFEATTYLTHHSELTSRDLIMLYTDGLYEVEGPRGDFFDQSMLRRAVEQRIAQPAEELFEEVLIEVQNFAVNGVFVDDVCLVGVEVQRLGEPAPTGLVSMAT